MIIRILVLGALSCLSPLSVRADDSPQTFSLPNNVFYQGPEDDVRFTLKFNRAAQLLDAFRGARYMGEYTDNGVFCASPDVNVELRDVRFVGRSAYDLRSVKPASTINLSVKLHAREDDCRLGNFEGQCTGSLPLVGPPGSKAKVRASCAIHWVGTPVTVDISPELELPFPIAVEPSHRFRLPSAVASGNITTNISFGHNDASGWSIDPPPADKEKSVPVFAGAAFHEMLFAPITNPTNHVVNGQFLTLRLLNSGVKITAKPEEAYTSYFGAMLPFQDFPRAIATLRVNEAGIANTSTNGTSGGILGAMFPLIVEGSYNDSALSTPIDLRIVLAEPQAKIVPSAGVPQMTIGFAISEVRLKAGDATLPVLPSPVTPSVTLTGPIVDATGQLRFEAASIAISVRTEAGGQTIALPLDGPILDAINKGLPNLARFNQAIVLETPPCILAGSRWHAWIDQCEAGRDDYVSRETPFSRRGLNLILSDTRIEASAGSITITFMADSF